MTNLVKLWCVVITVIGYFTVSLGNDDALDCKVDDFRGVCVPLPTCEPYLVLLRESDTTMEGLRLTQARQCGFEGKNVKVCCPFYMHSTIAPPTESPSQNEDYVDAFPRPGQCGTYPAEEPLGFARGLPEAGSRRYSPPIDINTEDPPAISGGFPVEKRESEVALWMALLGYRDVSVVWQCGGSVITARHVLTAAHCVKRGLYVARVGELDYAVEDADRGPIDFLVKRAIPHEEYTKFHNDIAVLVLDGSIDFDNNRHIAPICLPISPEDELTTYFTNPAFGVVTGWGEGDKPGSRSTHLLYAPVKILTHDVCVATYRDTNVTIDERVMCAGDAANKRDACSGDSGGPLINRPLSPGAMKSYFQIGIVSYGYPCKKMQYMGVYTNVTYFMPWIEEKVLGRRLHWAPKPVGRMPVCHYRNLE